MAAAKPSAATLAQAIVGVVRLQQIAREIPTSSAATVAQLVGALDRVRRTDLAIRQALEAALCCDAEAMDAALEALEQDGEKITVFLTFDAPARHPSRDVNAALAALRRISQRDYQRATRMHPEQQRDVTRAIADMLEEEAMRALGPLYTPLPDQLLRPVSQDEEKDETKWTISRRR